MATLADLKRRILGLIGDPEKAGSAPLSGNRVGTELLTGAVCAGLDEILAWVPQSKVATLPGDGATFTFALPADLYRIDAVYNARTKQFIRSARYAPGQTWLDTGMDQTYIEAPEGYITFSTAPTTEGASIYYAARWDKPALDTDLISSPEITHTGVVLYGAAYCSLALAAQIAGVRTYNTKVDSGTPEHNPMKDMAGYFLKWFETEMSRHPARMKGNQ